MHRLAATPGGWDPDTEGVVIIEQTSAPIIWLTAADTDIQTLASASQQLPPDAPPLRVVNLLNLQQQLTIDTYAETVLESAQVIILRLLGGKAYWSYGLEVVQETVQRTGAKLIVLPGDDRPDPDLISHSTVPLVVANQLWRYLIEGGVENITYALKFLANTYLGGDDQLLPPQIIEKVGWYQGWQQQANGQLDPTWGQVGILFYRAHYLAGNTAPIDALCTALVDRQLTPVPVFVSSLRDPDVQTELLTYYQPKDGEGIQVLLNTTSFSLAKLDGEQRGAAAESRMLSLWEQLDIPTIQVILSGGTEAQWRSQLRGLTPRDLAMNVALPEVDGRIISRAVSFKAVQTRHPGLETDVVTYQPVADRIQFVADLAANWVQLRQVPIAARRVALILANYPTRDGRLANGVGLDTPASCVEILKAMQQAGYAITDIPATGDELIRRLTQGITNDPEGWEIRSGSQFVTLTDYQTYFATLPETIQTEVCNRWGAPKNHAFNQNENLAYPIPGIQLGNVFVGIQPARGYDLDPSLNYHAPDLEPTHTYLAFYYWLRSHFTAQAIVHVGKHGNLEWLPGKSIALSETCYPEVAFGALPHFYPFIVNDPGEGAQAKRRAQAVIIDHLTPPMTRAELYGGLQKLEGLIDEYYEAQSLDPSRLGVISNRMTALIQQENLAAELAALGGNQATELPDLAQWLTVADRYLCELKEAQIRDGLHIFGQCPTGRQLRDLVVAIARHPGPGRLGLTRALAQDWGWEFDPLTVDPALPFGEKGADGEVLRTMGDAIEALENQAAGWVELVMKGDRGDASAGDAMNRGDDASAGDAMNRRLYGGGELGWIGDRLLPNLYQTRQEITYLLHGLNGGYVPAGAAGAPTRGRPEVLPTGRNFYSVDIRAIPTESAWDVGRKAAEVVIERYTQEQGEYPKTLGLSIWGTSTMRTGGDDLAEALALLGVQPVWEGISRRVIDFEILPLSVLGRPRVDVTLRISGFFRDAFPNLIDLFDSAVAAVAALAEPAEQNPLAAQVRQETQTWQAAGLPLEQADRRSRHRIFGSKPGAYGAGLQGLIEAQNWTDDADLARAYINWSSYAYTAQGAGQSAPEAFEQRLAQMQIVLHNQDNREHDLLDSDDYYQFQGGLTVAVRSMQGQNPAIYFGDHALPENPRVTSLSAQIAKVYRSRVINPKWIAGVMRHGYKGAFELSATVDYLFAYDATTRCVADYMYQGVADAYLLDPAVQDFVQQTNPWALRDMAERLLEAHQRGLWQQAGPETLAQLRTIVLAAEGEIEMKS
jgi:cobaltochelatase CobN